MGTHGKDACRLCGSKEDLIWVAWFKISPHSKTKGAWLCPQHDAAEAERYKRETR